jgi:3-hydroxy-9,10-secoandrosta-1,3,5(10)-triene-9,17-dione monooxygenase
MSQLAEAAAPQSLGDGVRSPGDSARFLERVDGILPLLRENTFKADEIRRVPESNIQAMTDAGIFRAIQPRQWGGLEIDPSTWEEALVRLGSACPSSGWVGGILGGHAWYLGLYSQQVQRELWGENPDVRIASSFAPTGKVERVSDGFRLTGRWKFLSGVDHARWICLAGIIPDQGDGPEYRVFLVPAADYAIDQDSWRVSGLQGSGSKDVTVDAIVPEYRTQTVEEVYRGHEPGKAVNAGPIFQLPWLSMWAHNIASPAIGAAVGALDAFVDDNKRRASALLGTVAAQNSAVHVRLAEAMTLVKDVRARIPRTWDSMYADVVAGVPVSNAKRAQCRFEASYAVGQCLGAVNKVFEVSGGAVLDSGKLFQHYQRGLMGMRNHPYAVYENWAGLYATTLFGFPLEPPFTKEHLGCLV